MNESGKLVDVNVDVSPIGFEYSSFKGLDSPRTAGNTF